MKWLFLILTFPIVSWAQSPELISIQDYNPQKKYDKPICIVDMYGKMECKQPSKKNNTETKAEDTKKYLKPASDKAWEGEITGTGIGTYRGVGTTLRYHTGHWSYGGSFKFNMYSPPATSESEADSKLEVLALGVVSYHIFPRWYSYAENMKNFDLSFSLQVGYNYITQTVEGSNRKSEPVVGLGSYVSYPLINSLRIGVGVDVYQNTALKSIGGGGSVGLGWEF